MFYSQSDLRKRWGLSRTTVWRLRRSRTDFPKPIRISPGRVVYALDEVEAFEQALRAERER